jgi:hypothetical protein
MPVSKIRGVNISWRVIGRNGPWVALTTGGRRGHDEFIPLATKIAAYGYRVMLHDRRNTGASDILIEGDEGEEVIWTGDLYELMSRHGALPAFFSGSFVRSQNVDPVLSSLSAGRPWLVVAARNGRSIRGKSPPRKLLRRIHSRR